MKKLIPIFSIVLLNQLTGFAQSTLVIGKTSIILPENKILSSESDHSISSNYLKFSNDTMYYYEVYKDKLDERESTLSIYILPLRYYIDKEDVKFIETRNEYLDGRISMTYRTSISFNFNAPNNYNGWIYEYTGKGKTKKLKETYFSVYSDDDTAYDMIMKNIK